MNRTTSTPQAAMTRRRCCLALGLGAWAGGSVRATALSSPPPQPASSLDQQSFAPLLAREWPADADPAGFLVSEKFDGVRALWDGRVLRFRSGRVIAAPPSFTERLPATPLDGELWLGRGRFEALSGMVRRQPALPEDWRALKYMVFEMPAARGDFGQRAAALQTWATAQPWPGLKAVAQRPVADSADLQRQLDAVVSAGGEGLMLHRADAPYVGGRGAVLFKHKPLHDAEALVLAQLPGQGRLAGRMGALQVRTDDGVVLQIGSGFSDAQRAAPPAPGQRITFTHRGLTAQGVPRFASFLRLAPRF